MAFDGNIPNALMDTITAEMQEELIAMMDPQVWEQMNRLFPDDQFAPLLASASPESVPSVQFEQTGSVPNEPQRADNNILQSDTLDADMQPIEDMFFEVTVAPSPVQVVQRPQSRRRGRPPITDPEEKRRRRQIRERAAARKYRAKVKATKVAEQADIDNELFIIEGKTKILALIEKLSAIFMKFYQDHHHQFSPEENARIRESLNRIYRLIDPNQLV